jgi:hypothetical protein
MSHGIVRNEVDPTRNPKVFCFAMKWKGPFEGVLSGCIRTGRGKLDRDIGDKAASK